MSDKVDRTNSNTAVYASASTRRLVSPTLRPLEVVGRLPSGVIPTSLLYADVKVILNQPWKILPLAGETDYFVVVWHVRGSAAVDLPALPLLGPISASDFPLELLIPMAYFLNNAVVDVSYHIHNLFEDAQVYESSLPVTVIFDRRAPGEGEVLKAPRFLIDPITELDMTSGPTIDVVVEGDFSGRSALDKVLLYFGSSNSFPTGLHTYEQVFVATTGVMTLKVPVEKFRPFAASPRLYCFYKVQDEALNFSQFSLAGSVALTLTLPVANLPVATVPAYDFDRLINRQDARDIVSFGISHYDNWMPGDQCIPELAGVKLAPVPVTSFPFSAPILWKDLIANGSDLVRKDNVSFRYFIQRAIDQVGPGVRSPLKVLSMDFTVFGRDHNLAPRLLNDLLALVNIFGAVSNTANQLDSRDTGLLVRADIVLPLNAKVGDSLSLFWPGQTAPVATYKVKPGDVTGSVVSFDNQVPWSVIQAGGINANTLVYYLTDNGVNQQQSANQRVVVNATPTIAFPRPAFPQTAQHANKFLSCGAKPPIWEEIQVVVTPGAHALMGDLITLQYQGYSNYPDRNPLVSTAHTLIHVWGSAETSYTFRITDYENRVRPLSDFAGASAKYSVVRNQLLVGTSAVAYAQVDRKSAGSGLYCGPAGLGQK
ncbi:hypothetical protein [Pseudomonas kitaguniensis]|uniref:hypothetical protein n=1 Tax=Pseudomonas kitaguniensis TaxID=2607908 RepID=UPI003D01FB3F